MTQRPRRLVERRVSSTRSIPPFVHGLATEDGVGDLAGIESRLDHAVDLLGVRCHLDMQPFVLPSSPIADFGYDVSDYRDVDPMFGDLAAFDRMLDAAHRRGLKVLLRHGAEPHPPSNIPLVFCRLSRQSAAANTETRVGPLGAPWGILGIVWSDPGPDVAAPPQQLDQRVRRPDLDLRRGDGAVLPAYLPLPSSRRSTGATRTSARRSWARCASGSIAGSTGFRVDAIENLVPTPSCADDRPIPPGSNRWARRRSPFFFFFFFFFSFFLGIHTQHPAGSGIEYVAEMRGVARLIRTGTVLIGEAYGTLEQIIAYLRKADRTVSICRSTSNSSARNGRRAI